jgi:methylmalonyl-CoA/ethylmalonyl-CoA epimerase
MITRIHHVAIVVRDLDEGLGFWRDTLELPLLRSADLPEHGVRAALLACGTGELEVLAPINTDSGVARFLESRGEGLHHLCFESDDVVREVRRFIGTGVDMIDGKPRAGLAGKVAFVHPRACGKLLMELVTPSGRGALPESPLAHTSRRGVLQAGVHRAAAPRPGPAGPGPASRGAKRAVSGERGRPGGHAGTGPGRTADRGARSLTKPRRTRA